MCKEKEVLLFYNTAKIMMKVSNTYKLIEVERSTRKAKWSSCH